MPTAPATSQFTAVEQWSMVEHLNGMEACSRKCDMYLTQIQDPQIKQLVTQCREMCARHAAQLRQTLQAAGMSV